jgi:leader peptidase (prepilin peptidase) / N-methyltransferase
MGYNYVMLILLVVILGWLSGWLVNYLTDVLPMTRSFSRPVCIQCGHPYRLVDYLFYRNCTSCGARRSWRSLIVQAAMTVTPVALLVFSRPLPFPLAFVLLIYLAVVLIIDLENRLILHPVSLVGLVIGLGIGIYMHNLVPTLLGGAAGFGVMLLFYFVGELYVRMMAKRKGLPSDEVALGFGDVNLSGILGLLLGWPSIVVGLMFAVLAGGVVSLIIILGMVISKRYKAFTAIPYAPFLILSTLILFIRG